MNDDFNTPILIAELFSAVCMNLDLQEKDYFGITYRDTTHDQWVRRAQCCILFNSSPSCFLLVLVEF